MKLYSVDEIRSIIYPVAIKHGVKSVSLFGSYSKGTASEDSDIDLLIEKGKIRTLFQLSGFRLDVEDALGKPVDLVTSESSDKDFLNMISEEEVVLYREA
jgi:predicted nucleotidyltransferase